MERRCTISRGLALARTWLAALLVVLLLALSIGSTLHHQDHQDGQHSCAACLIAHGSVLADGTTDTAIICSSHYFDLPVLGETKSASVFDLRLAPGRAPPV